MRRAPFSIQSLRDQSLSLSFSLSLFLSFSLSLTQSHSLSRKEEASLLFLSFPLPASTQAPKHHMPGGIKGTPLSVSFLTLGRAKRAARHAATLGKPSRERPRWSAHATKNKPMKLAGVGGLGGLGGWGGKKN